MKSTYGLNTYGDGYLQLINLKLGELPKTIEVEGDKMIIKNEFHISLVWIGRLSKMVDERNKDKIKLEMIEEFERFTENNSLIDYKLTGELRLVKKDGLKTVIAMAEVPNLNIFLEKLSEKYGVKLPVQPTHITLYTLPEDKIGIGILSEEELQKYSTEIDIPEFQKLL